MNTVLPQLSIGPKLEWYEKGVHIIRHADHVDNAIALGAHPQPTDIIVANGKPSHFARGGLRPHDDNLHRDFPETILWLCRAQGNRAVWWSEEPFEIIEINPSRLVLNKPAPYPYIEKLPFKSVGERPDLDGREIYVVRADVHIPAADNHMYKIVFTIGGEKIDPDMSCNP